ncbi:MAG TPA: YegS/Rv2252/BmrU family lipid kinase [Desulfosarcina sp.]|nr:YegS/Rv2252/BmrU family lipid kinase [Desulfosarcina sp.]
MPHNGALILVNKRARQGGAGLKRVRRVLEKGGFETAVHAFEDVAEIDAAVSRNRQGVDRIVVGGGDGTINAALEAVLASERLLGILPMETANELARTLAIPAEPEQAAAVIVRGRATRIEMGWVNGKHYCNVANIGLAARVGRTLTNAMKKRWGVLAYPLASFQALRSNCPFRDRITCNGRTRSMKSIQIAVGNGRHYGGGMTIRQDAAIDDHLLNFYSLEPRASGSCSNPSPRSCRALSTRRTRCI